MLSTENPVHAYLRTIRGRTVWVETCQTVSNTTSGPKFSDVSNNICQDYFSMQSYTPKDGGKRWTF